MAMTTSKEKGNAAFKAGDYATAIGHYTAAVLADPSDPTFFLNRAAAYLKLSKNEDAERDCTTVLSLSKTNAKALFRRAQARVALQKLGEAHNDLQRALKLDPNNEAVKAELVRVDELILSRAKGKTRSAPVQIPTPPPLPTSSPSTSTTTAPPKRRRVPITIVDDDAPQLPGPPSTSANASQPTKDLLNPISSRVLSPSTPTPTNNEPTPTPTSTPQPPAAQKPTPASFREAKQARDAKSVGRVGGGIFRMSGNDTVIKTREVRPRPASDTPHHPAPAPESAQTASASASIPATGAPRTLFEFTRAWDRIPPSDIAARWALLNTIHPTSLPAFLGASLEPTLLASLIPVLAAGPEHAEATPPRDTVRAYMCALTRVQRFKTVVLFLSSAERSAARAVWDAVVRDAGDASAAGNAKELEEVARMWGFAES